MHSALKPECHNVCIPNTFLHLVYLKLSSTWIWNVSCNREKHTFCSFIDIKANFLTIYFILLLFHVHIQQVLIRSKGRWLGFDYTVFSVSVLFVCSGETMEIVFFAAGFLEAIFRRGTRLDRNLLYALGHLGWHFWLVLAFPCVCLMMVIPSVPDLCTNHYSWNFLWAAHRLPNKDLEIYY